MSPNQPHSTAGIPDARPTYAEALARFAQLQAVDGPEVNPVCHSQLLIHGQMTERVIVLLHGMTNCPQQFCELGPIFFDQGYNVLIPRLPRNGLADRNTTELKNTTVAELLAFGNQTLAIATGLGQHVTVLGISASGVLAAWLAQFRPEVDAAVVIAPALGIVKDIPVVNAPANWLTKQICLRLPNLMTQRIQPFTAGPPQGYFGFATRALGEVIRLGDRVMTAARHTPPAARAITVVLNGGENAINNKLTRKLIQRWTTHGAKVTTYTFPAADHLIHDIIDPAQPAQQTAITYPVLEQLVAAM